VPNGGLLSDVAVAAGVHLDLRCGGNGVCRRCAVHWQGSRVLACQTTAEAAGTMQIPPESQVPEEWAVEIAFAPPHARHAAPRARIVEASPPPARDLPGVDDWSRFCQAALPGEPAPRITPTLLNTLPNLIEQSKKIRAVILDGRVLVVEDADTPQAPVLGAAIDLGTTTVVVRLMDLLKGEELASAGAQNRQVSLGANVISRIETGSTERGLQLLHKLVCEKTILQLLNRCLQQAGVKDAHLRRAVIGGNTVMTHLLLGLSPRGLGSLPFNAVTLHPEPLPGAELHLPIERVECLPCASAYVGGDITGGLYALGLERSGQPELLIDVGTNSEMVLRSGSRLIGAAAPAGPAFEGGGLSCGGPAGPGAVTHLNFDAGAITLETYRNTPPTHLCGTAYIDFMALGREHGFLSESGRLSPEFIQCLKSSDESCPTGGLRCELAKGVSIDERDISLLLQAKAAVLSGVMTLLRVAGLQPADLQAVHVAGGFGRHLNVANAIRCGLLPQVDPDCVRVVGNTSLAACSAALLNANALSDTQALAARVDVIELNLQPNYEDEYVTALMLP
jgi:uncharacterized 2Fe-2S/4Fe-4S cluster protein (DUF4445 family)